MSMPMLKRRWTVDDLADLPDDGNRYEIIDGELFVSAAPSMNHQAAVARLHRLLSDYLATQPGIGYAYFSPADVTFSRTRSVQPDVFVVPLSAGRRPRRFDDVGRLLLAAEVISPSTGRADRVKKRVMFRDEAVPEYWVVDLESRTFERSTPADARIERLDDQITWHPSGATSPLTIDVADYFSKVLDD
jgi:Uma2 family endonuclease